ncbi:NlpC/P60 family protein [Hansschlegelia zhihuaiae]|uniref:Peptidoglycan endopeptidase n=1 Tax=Hansschlegelia zhihuaiae TaxID=405005 RepID=A0A4Q0MF74_9HYPH|nr:NlpC/P60 family protein [Hansschlegelia zhihuaiae]RXF72127.1 peptidoglycan endopeptidase [Hansschlegelia zhihuaiae]
MTAWALDYRGVPFAEDGFTRDGLCCRGLVWLAFREVQSIEVETHRGRPSSMERAAAEALFRGAFGVGPWVEVERGAEREFDVAWFYEIREQSMTATHVGLVIRPGLMLHASRTAGVVTPEPYDKGLWSKLLIGFQRHELLADRYAA